ncbi:MAG TPA: hypothetical protein VF101_04995 [Gaiellaceae bacterium]
MWELIFLMLVLKIPIVYLCLVVWWAIRAEPRPLEGAARLVEPTPPHLSPPQVGFRRRLGPRRRDPRGGPSRGYPRTARAALARAEANR